MIQETSLQAYEAVKPSMGANQLLVLAVLENAPSSDQYRDRPKVGVVYQQGYSPGVRAPREGYGQGVRKEAMQDHWPERHPVEDDDRKRTSQGAVGHAREGVRSTRLVVIFTFIAMDSSAVCSAHGRVIHPTRSTFRGSRPSPMNRGIPVIMRATG